MEKSHSQLGRPAFVPTEEQRKIVAESIACGISQEDICLEIINPQTNEPIDSKTLRKYFREEVSTSSNALIRMAGKTVKECLESDDLRLRFDASKLILTTRGGWKTAKDEVVNAQPVININGMPMKTVEAENVD